MKQDLEKRSGGEEGTLKPFSPVSRRSRSPRLPISLSGTAVLNVGLTAYAGAVLISGPSPPMPAMKPIFHSIRPILAPGAAFGPETAVFCLETAPPFGAGAALDAPGAEFRPTGVALAVAGAALRRAGASLTSAGAEFCRSGASLDGAGAAVRRSGVAPISSDGTPAARSDAPMTRSGHPATRGVGGFQGSAETPLRITKPAGKSARAPLGAALCPQLFALCFA